MAPNTWVAGFAGRRGTSVVAVGVRGSLRWGGRTQRSDHVGQVGGPARAVLDRVTSGGLAVEPGDDAPRPRERHGGPSEPDGDRESDRQSRGEDGQPSLLVAGQARADGPTWDAHGPRGAHADDGVVPALLYGAECVSGQVGVLFGEQPGDQRRRDLDLSERLPGDRGPPSRARRSTGAPLSVAVGPRPSVVQCSHGRFAGESSHHRWSSPYVLDVLAEGERRSAHGSGRCCSYGGPAVGWAAVAGISEPSRGSWSSASGCWSYAPGECSHSQDIRHRGARAAGGRWDALAGPPAARGGCRAGWSRGGEGSGRMPRSVLRDAHRDRFAPR